MRRWFRTVLPPPWAVGMFLASYALFEAVRWWFWWRFQVPWNNVGGADPTAMVVGAAAVLYGCYRVMSCHPFFRAGYSQWLAVTPWTVHKPLPVGPAHLVPQDVVIVGLMTGLLVDHGTHWAVIPLLFLMSWHLTVCSTLWPTGAARHAYFLAFGLGGVVYLLPHPTMALILAAALVAVASLGLRDSLSRFPWTLPIGWEVFRASFVPGRTPPVQPETTIGWPFDQISPERKASGISGGDAAWISLLAGWWCWALASLFQNPMDQQEFVGGCLFIVSLGGSVLRVLVYCGSHWPPISLLGRLATFRWIIPGYDVVFLAPAAGFLFGVAGQSVHSLMLFSPAVVLLLFVPLILFALLGLGPNYERWRLTGNHRVGRKTTNRTHFIEH